MTLLAIVKFDVQDTWFRISRSDRNRYLNEVVAIVERYPEVSCRWYDAEPWSGSANEFLICTFESLKSYHQMWNDLRDHSIFTVPLVRIGKVLLGRQSENLIESDYCNGEGDGLLAVVELEMTHKWLGLSRPTREDYARQLVELVGGHRLVQCTWFDAEAWSGGFKNFMLCEFDDLERYQSLWNDLREHPFLAEGLALVQNICMGMARELATKVNPDCSLCGELLRPNAKFCTRCGASRNTLEASGKSHS